MVFFVVVVSSAVYIVLDNKIVSRTNPCNQLYEDPGEYFPLLIVA